MQQVSKLIPQGQGLAAVIVNRAPSLELDWDLRQKSRFDATTSEGRKVGVFLPRGTVIRGGDVLITTAGTFIRVIAAPQAVRTGHEHGRNRQPRTAAMWSSGFLPSSHQRPDAATMGLSAVWRLHGATAFQTTVAAVP